MIRMRAALKQPLHERMGHAAIADWRRACARSERPGWIDDERVVNP